jgi:hypothetical protein
MLNQQDERVRIFCKRKDFAPLHDGTKAQKRKKPWRSHAKSSSQ